jgi:hypothetical protein
MLSVLVVLVFFIVVGTLLWVTGDQIWRAG